MAKILVVDDERDFAELVSYNLKRHGHKVFAALSGAEALHGAEKLLPDLIVMDVMLPGIDGFSACEILRNQPPTNTIPILMYTALSGQIARLNGVEAGADEFLSKPFRLAEFLACVERLLLLRRRRMRAANAERD